MSDLSRRDLLLLAGAPALPLAAQSPSRRPPGETRPPDEAETELPEDFRIDSDHPRLFLPQRRRRLLQRERERRSIRWQQFELLMAGRAPMPETGFAEALYYQAGAGDDAGRRAVQWALSSAARDLRQLAIVFDWCQRVMTESQTEALATKLRQGFDRNETSRDAAIVRSRVLAAIALAGHSQAPSDTFLKWVVTEWWRRGVAPALKSGNRIVAREEAYPLVELMHAVRDNTNIEMRDSATKYFKEWPTQLLLGYYPSAYPAAENEYRIPIYHADGEPDLRIAMLARAADLAMVAYDTNALENQFLQGWLIHDRFLMRGTFGIVYEFLWANPYQPGLSYYHVPLYYHDPVAGLLLLRSSWEEDASWLAVMNGKIQVFQEGARRDVDPARAKPLSIGRNTVLFGADPMRFTVNNPEPALTYVLGLKPSQTYEIEVDDEEMTEITTDRAGLLALPFPPSVNVGVRLRSLGKPPAK